MTRLRAHLACFRHGHVVDLLIRRNAEGRSVFPCKRCGRVTTHMPRPLGWFYWKTLPYRPYWRDLRK